MLDLEQVAEEAKRLRWQVDGAFGRESPAANLVRYRVPALIEEIRRLEAALQAEQMKRTAELGPEPKTPSVDEMTYLAGGE